MLYNDLKGTLCADLSRKREHIGHMKKRIYRITVLLMVGLCISCSKKGADGDGLSAENSFSQVEERSSSASIEIRSNSPSIETQADPASMETRSVSAGIETQSSTASIETGSGTVSIETGSGTASMEGDDIGSGDGLEIDLVHDYSGDIKADVDHVAADPASLQEELEDIEKIIQKYTPLAEAAQTQGEMNASSRWFFVIWDTELNNLWGRFSDSADPQTKEKILGEQRNWIAMKEEVTLLSLGSREENGSMYPLLQNSFLEEITKNRAYVLANELAKIKGETFVMPERSAKYGLFVDDQGTGNVYSSLNTRQGWDGEDEAIISIYRQGGTKGTFVDNGNGELAFTSDDGNVKGIIKINGWDGASFQVTETAGESVFSVGEEVRFPFAF